jgi:hypothetical protein
VCCLLLQDDLYTILPILSITELVIILIYLGHISGCFFYLLSTPAWQTKRKHVHCQMRAFMWLPCCGLRSSVTACSHCSMPMHHATAAVRIYAWCHGSCSTVFSAASTAFRMFCDDGALQMKKH